MFYAEPIHNRWVEGKIWLNVLIAEKMLSQLRKPGRWLENLTRQVNEQN